MEALPGIWTAEPVDVGYQWQLVDADGNCRDIEGATERESPHVDALNGQTVRCVVTSPSGQS